MIENIQKIGTEICEWDNATFFLFSDNVFSALIYYSHLFPAILSLIFGIFVLFSNPKGVLNRLLCTLSIVFVSWSLIDLILWATEKVDYIMFFWSTLIYFEVLIYIITYIFVFYYLFRKGLPTSNHVLLFALFVPILLFAHTSLNLTGFDFTNCNREALEGPLWLYVYFIELVMVGLIIVAGLKSIKSEEGESKIFKNILICVGAVFFLVAFSSGNIFGSFALDWTIAQYGLFGMPIFIGILSYLVAKHGAFNTKILPTQVLVVSLWLFTFSLFFVQTLDLIRMIVVLNLALVSVLGYFLIRSVKAEFIVRQNLEKANEQQQSLMRFINHQVKGFFTRSRIIFDSLKNGEYGQLPPDAVDLVKVGFDTNTEGVQMVKSLLDAANLHEGTVQYKKVRLDFRALVSDIAGQVREMATSKGLTFDVIATDPVFVFGDLTHLAQGVRNLIENAIQYTEKGVVSVTLRAQGGRVMLIVSDSGLGLTPEDRARLFKQGGRGEEAIRRNVNSTGYGLYITKQIVKAHNGTIDVTSAGRDKGSTFTITIPIAVE